jgi:hypothetical protein
MHARAFSTESGTPVTRIAVLGFALLLSIPAWAADKGEPYSTPTQLEAENFTPKPEIRAAGIGTLKLQSVTDGYVASFQSVDLLTTYCSGACSGVSVGSWTCPNSHPYCGLDCTRTPPYKFCYR